MGYIAVTDGQAAIADSMELLKYYRSGGDAPVDADVVRDRLGLLVDRVMSEAGLYAPDFAALELKQCEGSLEERIAESEYTLHNRHVRLRDLLPSPRQLIKSHGYIAKVI